jgi:SNF2 family DNA or RNA helicase
MLNVNYRSGDRCAVLTWLSEDEASGWSDVLRRMVFDASDEAKQEAAHQISLPWWNFVALRGQFAELCRAFELAPDNGLIIGEEAGELLRNSRRAGDLYQSAIEAATIDEIDLNERLVLKGFNRERPLSSYQVRNVARIAAVSAAATFSVPGAGKTTEALATFLYRSNDDRLLVIAPKNAFASWEEQLEECLPGADENFTRLRGGREKIAKFLEADPQFMLITYQQLTRVVDLVAAHCAQYRVQIFLDESHRIKSGVGKQTARAVLGLAHLPTGKLIMSGTPMPQSIEDLVPQFAFLYPEIPANPENVVELIRPIYVRTNKLELGLRPVDRVYVPLPMAPMQFELYKLMKFEVAREAATALSIQSKQSFRSLGRSVARLLQYVSNPALLSSEISFAHPDVLSAVLAEGDGSKLKYVMRRTRQLAKAGHKVLVWSSFVRNVEYLAERLADLGAVYIHGRVDTGSEDDDESREGKIKLFHDNPNVKVLIANPAAASEGVSLHKICHHAIYLDRTFNAAHYLQSEDRIHRFGLSPTQETTVEIVQCLNTVDETVRERLDHKIGQMAEVLEDSSLRPDPIALDPLDIEDYEDYSTGLSPDDIKALLRDFGK